MDKDIICLRCCVKNRRRFEKKTTNNEKIEEKKNNVTRCKDHDYYRIWNNFHMQIH